MLAIATRIHLGKASTPPPQNKLNSQIQSFVRFASSVVAAPSSSSSSSDNSYSCAEVCIGIAVDTEEKISDYSLLEAVSLAVQEAASEVTVHLVPVSPWGNFVPALNALVVWSAALDHVTDLLFVSLETSLSPRAVRTLCSHVHDDDDTLVAGAVLPGHTHRGGGAEVPLDGRTTPWNTAAVWNVRKLARTGFPLVAEGLGGRAGGVEEVAAIAVQQRLPGTATAKLVRLVDDVAWEQEFEGDPARQRWHKSKMASKTERAAAHLELLGLSGTVLHL